MIEETPVYQNKQIFHFEKQFNIYQCQNTFTLIKIHLISSCTRAPVAHETIPMQHHHCHSNRCVNSKTKTRVQGKRHYNFFLRQSWKLKNPVGE